LANVSPGGIFTGVEAELFGIQKKDVQTLVCADESADESTIVVCDYSKSAAKDALEVQDCLGVSHQGDSHDNGSNGTCKPVREQRRVDYASICKANIIPRIPISTAPCLLLLPQVARWKLILER
jgi:hypothetical protein